MRDIAAVAGLSTGAVFASFTDKADLFAQVMDEDDRALVAAMRAADAPSQDVETRLTLILSAAAACQLGQSRLLSAAESAAWSAGVLRDTRPERRQAIRLLCDALQTAVESGRLSSKTDVELLAETLWDCLMGNLRRAQALGQDAPEIDARMAQQASMLLAGARPKG
jgi:AcrR family transcriptional regulator